MRRLIEASGTEAELNRALHIWRKPRFIYIGNPICACSTLKLSLNLSVAKASGATDFALTDAADIHNRRANLLLMPQQVGYAHVVAMLRNPEVPVFTFVRSPESRLLSAYRKKLMGRTPFASRVAAHLGLSEDKPLHQRLSLDDFAMAIAEDPSLRDLDGHWRLQRKQIHYDILPHLLCLRVENFARDAQSLFTRIFGAADYILRDAATLNRHNVSRRADLPGFSPKALAAIRKAYAADYDMLDAITHSDQRGHAL
jgi:hypothetical protein